MSQIQELLSKGKHLLSQAGMTTPALDAALLLAEILHLSREQLHTHSDSEVNVDQCERYFAFLERRRQGECIAYILGHKDFWDLEFIVSPSVLVPRPDTEILVEAALAILHSFFKSPSASDSSPLLVLDLCTGSGAVAIALKHELPGLEVTASDISEEALETARKNAERLNCKITFLRGDLFNAVTNHHKPLFDLITANAPYIPSADLEKLPKEVRNEPRVALDGGLDGLDIIRRIITKAPSYLKPGGKLALEADPSQMNAIAALIKDRCSNKPALYRDLSGKDRVISMSNQSG